MKFRVKDYLGCMIYLKYFYLEHISLAIIHATVMEHSIAVTATILLIATTL